VMPFLIRIVETRLTSLSSISLLHILNCRLLFSAQVICAKAKRPGANPLRYYGY
jgi:hypothetical protein